MNAATHSTLGCQVSDTGTVGPCILAMRQAFKGLEKLSKNLKFIADGYSAYLLAAMEFFHNLGNNFKFNITQVIGLTNDDKVSKEYRPYKQMTEHLNQTYEVSYRPTNEFDNYDDANQVTYYNFLRPHQHNNNKVLNKVKLLENADNMPSKWQLLIYLGQQTILNMQQAGSSNSS